MLEKKRDKLEIMRNILLICKKGDATKTRIVYQANLNFKTAGIYLNWLINKDLIAPDENFFRLTTNGTVLLSNLQDISSIIQ